MAVTHFIADTHFGDDAIRRYENRPFESTAQMDAELTARWNAVVGEEDKVYVLGDFCVPGREKEILSRLKGRKYLVKGNHDLGTNEAYRRAGFSEVYDHPVILDGFWILSHEAMYVNTNMPYANLFGHVHNSPLFRDFSPQHYCVCVERTGFAPISFDSIRKAVREAAKNAE